VRVPIEGKKKKLKHSIATTEAIVDSTNPPLVAMKRMTTKKRKPAVVGFTGTTRYRTNVVAAMSMRDALTRRISRRFLRIAKTVGESELRFFSAGVLITLSETLTSVTDVILPCTLRSNSRAESDLPFVAAIRNRRIFYVE
jgi:hypothetical protein